MREGEGVQFLCGMHLDIGAAAGTAFSHSTSGRRTTSPVPSRSKGRSPGDVVEVEIAAVAPLVDFGYVTIEPAPGLFGGRCHRPTLRRSS